MSGVATSAAQAAAAAGTAEGSAAGAENRETRDERRVENGVGARVGVGDLGLHRRPEAPRYDPSPQHCSLGRRGLVPVEADGALDHPRRVRLRPSRP